MGVLLDLVTRSIVTNTQCVVIRYSDLIIEFVHDLMMYFTSHPAIFGSIPADSVLLQATRSFRFAYD